MSKRDSPRPARVTAEVSQCPLSWQVEKVRQLRAMIGDRPIHIEIDGGVDARTAPLVRQAGADVLVAGSAVFSGGSAERPEAYGQNIRAIRTAAEAASTAEGATWT